MNPPWLKLAFVQGPRDGDSLEFKPGSTIRIGRVVRGNEITIKDAGISSKHIRIVSDSENWIIHDLGSSNGTILNSDTLDQDTPVILRHGDTIKLGEYTSIEVNFVTDVQVQEHKLPPRPRRNNRRLAVADLDPVPVVTVQEKPTRKGVSSKQDQHEMPKRTRVSRNKNLENIADKEKELEVNSRVTRSLKKESRANSCGDGKEVAITTNVEIVEEKRGNSRVQRGKKTESIQNLIKLETEDTPEVVEISAMKKATRSKEIENASLGLENINSEDTAFKEKDGKKLSRATRSKRNEIGGDSFMDLEMVLKQARKTRAKKKKLEQKPSKRIVEMEARNDDVREEDKDNETQKDCSERNEDKEDKIDSYDGTKRVNQEEIELREEDMNSTIGEDEETKNSEDTIQEAGIEKLDDGEKRIEVDLRKMTFGEWFDLMEVQLPKQIKEETEKMIEPMRSKSQRVQKYIAEQK